MRESAATPNLHDLFSSAGRAFLVAFAGSLVILGPGVLAAPSIHQAYLLGVAALLSSIAAGITALQEFVPQLSFVSLLGHAGVYVDAFVRAALASLCVTIPGLLNAPDLGASWKSLGTAALVGAATAGVRALRAFFTAGETPNPGFGL